MVIVACLALNIFNPAFTFKQAMVGLGGLGSKKKALKQQRVAMGSGNGSESEDRTATNTDIEDGRAEKKEVV